MTTQTLVDLYERLVVAVQAGQSTDALAKEYFGGDDTDDRRERFKCLMCRDTGFVEVVNAFNSIDMKRIFDGAPITAAGAACSCDRGTKMNSRRRTQLGVYSPLNQCRIESFPINRGKMLVKLREFLTEFAKSKRHSCFDQYNNETLFK